MKNRYRHHRKHKSGNRSELASPAVQASHEPVVTAAPEITHDLRKTGLITGLLLISLLALYFSNTHSHWTLSFGARLYQLLHIR